MASAHDFGIGKDGYEDFLIGNLAVFTDTPVILLMLAAAFLISIWKADGLPQVWAFYVLGAILGALLGFAGILPPALPAFIAVIVTGLLGAVALNVSVGLMRALVCLIGIVLGNAILSGHTMNELPLFAYFGLFFALNLGLAIPASIVAITRDKLPYSWVLIVWRAGASWLVAVAVIAMMLMTVGTG